MSIPKEDHMQKYSHRVQVGADYIELYVSMEPVELTWEWRISERYDYVRSHRFKTFADAKRAGLYAVMDRIELRKNQWTLKFDQTEGEILDAK